MKQTKDIVDKQDLKRQRIKMYFLDAAKRMILEEGVESVSVRKVADIAGYSYATLYNYFQDLNELLWNVKKSIIYDLLQSIQRKTVNIALDTEGIKLVFKIYMEYYLENPNVFKFFYFHQLNEPSEKGDELIEEPDFNVMLRASFQSFVDEGKLREADVEVVGKTCIYAVHGMLTLFFSGNGELTKDILDRELDKIIDYLL